MASKPKNGKLAGWLDLEQIARGIMGREATGKIFDDNELIEDDDPKDAVKSPRCNWVSFNYHSGSRYPTRCVVLLKDAAAPKGHTREWSGTMMVEAEEAEVVLYRED